VVSSDEKFPYLMKEN